MNNSGLDLEKQIDMNSHSKMYYKGKMKILYIDYNDITKHVVLQDVMGHAVNKLYNKKNHWVAWLGDNSRKPRCL